MRTFEGCRSQEQAALKNLGFDTISIDDVQRMQWEPLEVEIAAWIKISSPIDGNPSHQDLWIKVGFVFLLFSNLVRSMVIQLLTFADAVVLTNQISSLARGATAEEEDEQLAANFSSLRTLHLILRQERGESA
ncbi:hypothetical protein U1Q18_020259 [Sarracenia purpurea var. burkii]